MTDPDVDPMLGDSATQDAYRAQIAAMMKAEADRLHAERRLPSTAGMRETDPVMLGDTGFTGGISNGGA